MNEALDRLAQEVSLNSASERLRLEFGYACVCRVEQFIEQAEVLQCLQGLGAFLAGAIERAEFDALAAKAEVLANHHQGSRSLDGSGHAAVSATYAVANALAGKARQAADYAAMDPVQAARRIQELEQRMYQHARDLEFEDAARVRDQIRRLKEASLAG